MRYLVLDRRGSVLAERPALDLARRVAHLAFPDAYAWIVRADGDRLTLLAHHPDRSERLFAAPVWAGSRAERMARRAS